MQAIVWRSILIACGLVCSVAGCSTFRTTETPRTGLEQLLISNAVDQSLDKIDFEPFHGTSVFIDDKYLDGVDKNYVLGSVRHRLMSSGVTLAAKQEDSDITVEIRSGGLGTDKKETFVGIPEIAIPFPLPVQLPELRLFNSTTQYGTAKLGLAAYATNTGQPLGSGGVSLARSDDKNRYVFGVGPFNAGSVQKELMAGTQRRRHSQAEMFSIAGLSDLRKPPEKVAVTERQQLVEQSEFEDQPPMEFPDDWADIRKAR